MSFYPWLQSCRSRIERQFETDKLAHAILLTGPRFMGKFDFAVALASQFLCESPDNSGACGHCASCHQIAAGSHSDLRLVEPEDSSQIKIDQIRDLIGWVSQTAQRGGLKIAIVNPADQMNHQSANALLKCLEEPTPKTLIILITAYPGTLLPTVRSRCQQYKLSLPDRDRALEWLSEQVDSSEDTGAMLDMADGLPLAVIQKFDNDYLENRRTVVKTLQTVLSGSTKSTGYAASILKQDPGSVLEVAQSVLSDCIRFKLSSQDNILKNKDIIEEIVSICHARSSDYLFLALDRVGSDLKVLGGTTNPNKTLLIESLLIDLGDENPYSLAEYTL